MLVRLGDVVLGLGESPATSKRIREAPGRRKVLVIGNHDLAPTEGDVRRVGPVNYLLPPTESSS